MSLAFLSVAMPLLCGVIDCILLGATTRAPERDAIICLVGANYSVTKRLWNGVRNIFCNLQFANFNIES